ncbi:hypothetical protein AHiyo8_pI69720 (plasmid) [Arthrobacter sp. Hiyo8]|nr:hypothetical protein AHiyo8_pI69720 [Arthrobacter sp. Hiyo8]
MPDRPLEKRFWRCYSVSQLDYEIYKGTVSQNFVNDGF